MLTKTVLPVNGMRKSSNHLFDWSTSDKVSSVWRGNNNIYTAGLLLKKVLRFLLASLFIVSLGVLLFELTLTRIFSIILWYNYAFVAISVAFFGLGIGALVIHSRQKQSEKRRSYQRKFFSPRLRSQFRCRFSYSL